MVTKLRLLESSLSCETYSAPRSEALLHISRAIDAAIEQVSAQVESAREAVAAVKSCGPALVAVAREFAQVQRAIRDKSALVSQSMYR